MFSGRGIPLGSHLLLAIPEARLEGAAEAVIESGRRQNGEAFALGREDTLAHIGGLTFDMSGRRKPAKLAFGCPLDGRVSRLVQ